MAAWDHVSGYASASEIITRGILPWTSGGFRVHAGQPAPRARDVEKSKAGIVAFHIRALSQFDGARQNCPPTHDALNLQFYMPKVNWSWLQYTFDQRFFFPRILPVPLAAQPDFRARALVSSSERCN